LAPSRWFNSSPPDRPGLLVKMLETGVTFGSVADALVGGWVSVSAAGTVPSPLKPRARKSWTTSLVWAVTAFTLTGGR